MRRSNWCIMLILRILILFFISRVAPIELSVTKNANNYGPYNIKWYNYVTCHGPKPKDVAVTNANVIVDDNELVIDYNTTFFVPTKIDEIRLVVYNVNGQQKTVLWNYKVNKPCQHFLIAGIFQQYMNMHNCLIKAGSYIFKSNFTEIAMRFFGESFFYGDYMFKITVFAKQANVGCISVNALFTKKT